MGIAFNDAVLKVLKTIVIFVMILNEWIKEKIFLPVAMFLVMVWNLFMEVVRNMRGDDLYQPVTTGVVEETTSN